MEPEIDIECETHGLFSQTPGSHLLAEAVLYVAMIVEVKQTQNPRTNYRRIMEVHGEYRYDYSLVKYLGCFN